MRIEKIIKRKSGLSIKIEASLSVEHIRNEFYWSTDTKVRSKGYRRWRDPTESEKPKDSEVSAVMHELWAKVAPPKDFFKTGEPAQKEV